MDDLDVLRTVQEAEKDFGIHCKKVSGTLTVETFMKAFSEHGVASSARDVFIRGLPVEIDLLIPRPGVGATTTVVYEPDDVLAAFEVKRRGCFGEKMLLKIQETFQRISVVNPRIFCAYLALEERRGYKYAVTETNLGFPAYTLFWYTGSGSKQEDHHPTGDWNRLLERVAGLLQNRQ